MFRPFGVIKTGLEYYKLQQETRAKTDKMQNVLLASPYKDFTPEMQQQSLTKAGFLYSDVPIKTTTTSEVTGDSTFTATTKFLDLENVDFGSVTAGRSKYFMDQGQTGKARLNAYLAAGTHITEALRIR